MFGFFLFFKKNMFIENLLSQQNCIESLQDLKFSHIKLSQCSRLITCYHQDFMACICIATNMVAKLATSAFKINILCALDSIGVFCELKK